MSSAPCAKLLEVREKRSDDRGFIEHGNDYSGESGTMRAAGGFRHGEKIEEKDPPGKTSALFQNFEAIADQTSPGAGRDESAAATANAVFKKILTCGVIYLNILRTSNY